MIRVGIGHEEHRAFDPGEVEIVDVLTIEVKRQTRRRDDLRLFQQCQDKEDELMKQFLAELLALCERYRPHMAPMLMQYTRTGFRC